MSMNVDIRLLLDVLAKFLIAILVLASVFFSTAGSFEYVNGWIYLGTILIILFIGLTILYIRDKELLRKRIKTKETDPKQKSFVFLSAINLGALYALPGFDYRYHWSDLPGIYVVLGEIILISGYALNLAVMLQNSYASRVVEIQENQKVITTGLYSLVRHPMYASLISVYLGTCLVLGSLVALIPCTLMIGILGFRAVNEEKTLIHGLDGYAEYMKRVKYRFLPFIW